MLSRRRALILSAGVFLQTSLMFSSAMANETDIEAPIMGISASLQADPFVGALTGSIPIQVLAGRNGMQPQLALTYTSNNGTGWVGMGWKLEMATIERQTKWGVLYSPTLAEEQAGKVYAMHLNGAVMDLVQAPPPAPSDEYRAKIEGAFLRIKKNVGGTSGWEVTDSKGTKYTFGTTTGSRVQSSDGTKVFKWCLERIEDPDGNYLTVTYQGDGATNQQYLSQINYAGNNSVTGALPTTNTVKFYLEDRTDKPVMYTSNFPITTGKRLKTIGVYSNPAMTELVLAYGLTYTTSGNTSRSLLATIRQFGKDAAVDVNGVVSGGTSLPEINLSWKAGAPGSLSSLGSVIPDPAWSSPSPGDFNGDGRTDFIINEVNTVGTLWRAYLSNGNGSFTAVSGSSFYNSSHSPMPGDFDGDGRTDILINTNVDWRIFLSNGNGTFTDTSIFTSNETWHSPMPGDFNGDGRTDFLINTGTEWRSYLSNGNGTFSYASTVTLDETWHFPMPGDFDGDGRTDFGIIAGTQYRMYLSNGDGTFSNVSTVSSFNPQMTGDFNGDGRTDFLTNNTTLQLLSYLSNGDGTFSYASTVLPSVPPFQGPMPGDFNGDRRTDFLINTGTEWRTYLSNGNGTFSYASTVSPYEAWSSPMSGDFNGDGKDDFIINTQTTNAGWYVYLANTVGGGVPDLLNSVANGIGGATTITYVPSTQYANTRLPYPIQTVSAITRCENWNGTSCTGTSSTTSYTYDGGYHNLEYRDFRGFKHATVISPTGPNGERTTTETWFHQGAGTGPTEDTGEVLTHPDAPTKGRPYRILVQDSGIFSQLETITTYANDIDTLAPWYTPSSQVVTRTYAGGAIAKETQVDFTYDHAYGNVIREEHRGDIGVIGDEKTIDRDFANETTAWLIGFPTRETIYKGISTAAQDKMAETTFYYDGTTTCTTASSLQVPTRGHLTRTVNWLNGGVNPETWMAYDDYGNRICRRDPRGNQSTYVYDGTHTYLRTVTNALGHVITTQYAGVDGQLLTNGLYGQVLSETDPNNQASTYTYDALGRPLSMTTSDGLLTTWTYPTLAEYGLVGTQAVTTTLTGGGLTAALTSRKFFDGLGRTIVTESPGAGANVIRVQRSYDARGNIATQTAPFFVGQIIGPVTATVYDDLGRISQTTYPDQTVTRLCYSGWDVNTLDAKGHRKRETKDAFGRVVKVEQFNGIGTSCTSLPTTVASSVTYTYDVLGNLLTSKDILNNTSTMTYDSLGRKLTMQDPDMGSWSYTYDVNGNLLTQVDAKNQKLCFTYDALNRRTQKNFGTTSVACGTNTVVYTYDDPVTANNGKGRLRQVTDPAQTVTFQYDSRGRITQSAKTIGGTTYVTTSTYDGLGRLVQVKYPTTPVKTVDYVYTGPWLLKVMEGTTTYVQYANYNVLGQAGTETYGNGVVTANTYEPETFRLKLTRTEGSTRPTAPANLTATVVSSSQIDVSWSVAMDNTSVAGYRIERCRGAGCSDFAEIAWTAVGTLNYSDTGLLQGSPYTYRVRAIDSSSMFGAYSLTATAIPTDTAVPTAPSALAATVVSTTQITLTWTASTDNSNLITYRIERCQGIGCTTFVEIGSSSTTFYADSGLTASTTYQYRVRAVDPSNNGSAYSSTISAVTTMPSDTSPPTAPGSLTATVAGSTQINLSWTAATDNVGVTVYRVERCQGMGCSNFVQIATATTLTFSSTGLTTGNSYSYRVRAVDAAGNLGAYSSTATAITADTISPTVPSGLSGILLGYSQIGLVWTGSMDASGVIQYQVERCQGTGCTTFALLNTTVQTLMTDTGLLPSFQYRYRIRAIDMAGNLSGYSSTISVTTQAPMGYGGDPYGIAWYGY